MAEIQIRTIAMNLWASLEHELKYKSEDDVSEELKIRLKNNADTIAKVDMEMQSIFRELKQKNNIENICCRGMRK